MRGDTRSIRAAEPRWYHPGMRRDRSIIVTGGTGALGRAIVQAILDAGDIAIVPWIDKPSRMEAAKSWGEPVQAGRVALIEADIGTPEGAARVAAAAPEVEALICAAGGFAGGTPVADTPLEVFDDMYRINVRTAVAMTQAVLPGMRRRNRGAIVCVAAQAAYTRPPTLAAYSASKSALIAFTETLQKELAGTAIRANALAPGVIDTPANREAMPGADTTTWTDPKQIAQAALWLTTPPAAAVRGAVLPV
jgi:NAD(P)-dependent dehydrogenase (short-subunit alcohol dehydrogenase family)